jgi:hypothetical protein
MCQTPHAYATSDAFRDGRGPTPPLVECQCEPTLDRLLREIAEILWPFGDPDAQWSSDEIEAVANVLDRAGLRPATPTCDICGKPEDHWPAAGEYDWNGETGNHRSCEEPMTA